MSEEDTRQSNRDITQSKAFMRWANVHLKSQDAEIANITHDFTNGINLVKLASALTGKQLKPTQKDKMTPLFAAQNLGLALTAFNDDGCELHNIHASTLAQGDSRMTMGLLWQLIQSYTISSTVGGQGNDDGISSTFSPQITAPSSSSSSADTPSPSNDAISPQEGAEPPSTPIKKRLPAKNNRTLNLSMVQVKNHLIEFVNHQYDTKLSDDDKKIILEHTGRTSPLICSNLESDWSDAALLFGLLLSLYAPDTQHQHKIRDDIINKTDKHSSVSILDAVLLQAEIDYGIPQLVDGHDLSKNPDGNTNVTYITYYVSAKFNVPKKDIVVPEKESIKKEEEVQQQQQQQTKQGTIDPVPETAKIAVPENVPTHAAVVPSSAKVSPTDTDSLALHDDEVKLLELENLCFSAALSAPRTPTGKHTADKKEISEPDYTAAHDQLGLLMTKYNALGAEIDIAMPSDHIDKLKNRVIQHIRRLHNVEQLLRHNSPVTTQNAINNDLNLYLVAAIIILILAIFLK